MSRKTLVASDRFLMTLGASGNKTEDDNLSIMAAHQSYFDEYPSGTGNTDRLSTSDVD
jgi:hypothetical protein